MVYRLVLSLLLFSYNLQSYWVDERWIICWTVHACDLEKESYLLGKKCCCGCLTVPNMCLTHKQQWHIYKKARELVFPVPWDTRWNDDCPLLWWRMAVGYCFYDLQHPVTCGSFPISCMRFYKRSLLMNLTLTFIQNHKHHLCFVEFYACVS